MMKKITIVTLVLLATTDPTSSTSLLSRQRRLRARQHLTTHRTSATALTATDPDPGMVMEATINKLKSTETLLRDTQTSMQSAVDKMVAKRSIGLDKHIAHTTEMVMKAFHKQEMTNLQRSTEARMNKWINSDNTISLLSVDPLFTKSTSISSRLITLENFFRIKGIFFSSL